MKATKEICDICTIGSYYVRSCKEYLEIKSFYLRERMLQFVQNSIAVIKGLIYDVLELDA